ncbi:cation:proton antiporter [Waterburya agarophytonicola K14]|uniref:Cation:proton antiporter n=1 Tax=Waterburya agarophytonicola KI4 TaxID=2874699 RepID=A0A964BSJ7_9CYAN|nr:cation:proton antiporter [Waterburya agarophytonicola]MCC0177050.1 cation:proton antiporter [Waterburya agarophytonicola KI4]
MPDNLLFSFILLLLGGFIGGEMARKIGAPPLLGMMLVGILLGSEVGNLISDRVLALADDLRAIAVTIILMRAGLGLDRDKLKKQGSVALRLGFLPALTEAIAISFISIWLFDFNWLTGLLLGCVISAESPAVIVPGMLRLKNLGWGVSKGIADAILTGSALSDVLILLLFSLLLNFISSGEISHNDLWLLPLKVISQVILGVIIGYLAAKLIVFGTVKQKWTQNSLQDTLITVSIALLLVVLANRFPYFSGYLAVMAMGFFAIEFSPPLARRLRQEFNNLWIVAEIILFFLMGATIQLKILVSIFLPGLLLLILGLLLGRTIGWYLATLGSNWTTGEKLFLLPGNSAKATVQAAIGAIPLSMGIPGGDKILAIAALSILVTAPIGAWAIPAFAPKLLTKSEIDPTKTNLATATIVLGITFAPLAFNDPLHDQNAAVLTKVADLARRTNGEAIIICVAQNKESDAHQLELLTAKLLLDIPHKFVAIARETTAEIIHIAQEYQVSEIIVAQQNPKDSGHSTLRSLTEFILENSNIPVLLLR